MQFVPPTGKGLGAFALVDDNDFEKACRYSWHLDKDGYARTNIRKPDGRWTTLRLHNLVFPAPEGLVTDHRDTIKLHCCKDNLRSCIRLQNSQNCSRPKDNTRGYKGVRWAKKERRWVVIIGYEGFGYCFGFYTDREEAAYIVDQVALQLLGDFARTNLLH